MEKTPQKLRRQDWLTLGLNVLAKNGIEAMRVERLAELMNVTKGSFYWHFKNREDLLMAMLQEWEVRETDNIIKQVEAAGGNASTKLFNLFQIASQDDGRLEKAIRNWAANDTRSAAAIARIDLRRINYMQTLFLQMSFPTVEAKARARLAYYSWIGEFIVGVLPTQAERLEEAKLYHTILVRHD
ncbi:TetR/AcrR family transcriptional regulator [Gloeocapsopsis dulcis]|nr:TetR/AcrR family transcriptional regulator [Gloeocapsopsis dulcis]WNN90215.1 TetR/AcrR family transcriptional regulator [Gloeocapsopsis dulcis]